MPRLPTIRVMGSHDISTSRRSRPAVSRAFWVMVAIRHPFLLGIGARLVAGLKPWSRMPPLRLFVDGAVSETAKRTNRLPVHRDHIRGDLGARRLVHERHELVGEAGHGAADANAADVGTASDSG